MKTPIKPAVNFKRLSLIILMSMFVIIGIQSQKSLKYSFYVDTNILKEVLADIVKFDLRDEISEYYNYPMINERGYKIYPLADNLVITIEVLTDIDAGNMNMLNEEDEKEMEIECWMLNDFNVKPCKSRKSISTDSANEEIAEEEMEIEDWMLNTDMWAAAAKQK